MSSVEYADKAHVNAKTGLAPVELNKKYLNYNAGEVVGVKPEIAQELVEGKHAKYVKPADVKPAGK